MLQIKILTNLSAANQFLKQIPSDAVKSIKPIDHQYQIVYDADRHYEPKVIPAATASRVIDLIAAQADRAWSEVDEEAGGESLPMAIVMLINQTLAHYFPADHPLTGARATIKAPTTTTTLTNELFQQLPNAAGWRLYAIQLNTTPYDAGIYGYVLAASYPNEPNYHQDITRLLFLDTQFKPHGNRFDLDAETVTQWKL